MKPDSKKIFRKIYLNGELNFEVTTKFLPEVRTFKFKIPRLD